MIKVKPLHFLFAGYCLFAASHINGAPRTRRATLVGKHCAKLDFQYEFYEGGVSALSHSRYLLNLRLNVSSSGAAMLLVNGTSETQVIMPHKQMTRVHNSVIGISWVGKIKLEEASPRLDLRFKGFSQELQCVVSTKGAGERFGHLLRCSPITRQKGFPWKDPLPPYLRVPLIFGIGHEIWTNVQIRAPVGESMSMPHPEVILSGPARHISC